jgi:c-di-GMP-binding flagellar brake protein YcgR
MKERRREFRQSKENDVSLGFINHKNAEILTEISIGLTKDLSMKGMKMVSRRGYPVNTPVKIILPIHGNSTCILRIGGKVIWNIDAGDGEFQESGIEFLDISPVQSLTLLDLLFGKSKKPIS